MTDNTAKTKKGEVVRLLNPTDQWSRDAIVVLENGEHRTVAGVQVIGGEIVVSLKRPGATPVKKWTMDEYRQWLASGAYDRSGL